MTQRKSPPKRKSGASIKTTMSLNELRDEALRIAVEHGFKDASVPEDIALMHSELSEALEEHRNGGVPHETWYEFRLAFGAKMTVNSRDVSNIPEGAELFGKLGKPIGMPSEMADVIIRILHFAGKHGIDLDKAVTEKMAYNEYRPYRHGGKKI